MRLIPVLDLKSRQVVRAVGGRRDEYRPVVSSLTPSHSPLDVAHALVERFQPAELYVADLDAIAGGEPDWRSLAEIRGLSSIWVDAGVKRPDDARRLAEAGCAGVVCGLETVEGPEVLASVVAELGPDRAIFSLDLRAGKLLGNLKRWPAGSDRNPLSIIDCAVGFGVCKVIVIDLAQVGEGRGTGTEELCRHIAFRGANIPVWQEEHAVELFAGGGVRGVDDLKRLKASGVSGVLAASALHDGTIRLSDLPRLFDS